MAKEKKIGQQTIVLENPPSFIGFAAVVGKKEGEGPLGGYFDFIGQDTTFGEKTWEKAESRMQKESLNRAIAKSQIAQTQIDYLFAGDLLNQCIGSTYGLREYEIPLIGLYGACSTMIEGISLAAMTIDGGYANYAAAITSSHFCSAERQFRMPLEYGGQRPPTAQWTVTGSGSVVLAAQGQGPYVTHITLGKIVDMGVKDVSNMGGAMAPAAFQTLHQYFADTKTTPQDYDLILSGDLGLIGKEVLEEFFKKDGVTLSPMYQDCGCMIYDFEKQDVNSGGSGCGCCASVLTGYVLPKMKLLELNKVLVMATGALMSTTATQQGESVPGIAHLICLSTSKV